MKQTDKNNVDALQQTYLDRFITCYRDVTDHPNYMAEIYQDTIAQTAADGQTSDHSVLQRSLQPLDVMAITAMGQNKKSFLSRDNHAFLQDNVKNNLYAFYSLYVDLIIDTRRAHVRNGTCDKSDFMLQPSASPSIEAYDKKGWTRFDIAPSLRGYPVS